MLIFLTLKTGDLIGVNPDTIQRVEAVTADVVDRYEAYRRISPGCFVPTLGGSMLEIKDRLGCLEVTETVAEIQAILQMKRGW